MMTVHKIRIPWAVKKYILISIAAAIVLTMGVIGFRVIFSAKSETVELGFKDIGELATQVVSAKEVNVTDKSSELFGVKLPFTQSKYIYSYDVEIKAGFDFEKITGSVNSATKTIVVYIPEARVLGNEIDPNSFQLYHEQESIFQQISLAENNEALIALREKAQQRAIENGLLEKARENAEMILTAFIGQMYDLDEYKLTFTGP